MYSMFLCAHAFMHARSCTHFEDQNMRCCRKDEGIKEREENFNSRINEFYAEYTYMYLMLYRLW